MDDNLRTLIAQGLHALRAGTQVAARATAEIQNDARHPKLQRALEEGNHTSRQWAQRIEAAIAETGGEGPSHNPILEAHYEVSKPIRAAAADERSRDLGIVAAGQLALHYWIAGFGTLRTYAEHAGLPTVASTMRQCLEEAKTADEAHSGIAAQLLGARAGEERLAAE